MKKRTYTEFFALFKTMQEQAPGLDRQDIIFDFTAGRTNSLRDLSTTELRDLVSSMREDCTSKPEKEGERMRRQIIAIFHEMGYKKADGKTIDMNRVNAWCVKFGHIKQPLNDYEYMELPKLVSQCKIVLDGFIEKQTQCLN